GLVSTLCFVGCALLGGYDFGDYKEETAYEMKVGADPDLVAYWPLNDSTESPDVSGATATDFGPNKINGTYEAPVPGTVKLQQTGIVPGDSDQQSNARSMCAFFNGGFVQVGFDSRLNPSTSFSVAASVQREWKLTDEGMVRIGVASDDSNNLKGYQLHATAENHWAASVGTGSQFVIAKPDPASPPTVKPGEPNYLVATFDVTTGTLSLY